MKDLTPQELAVEIVDFIEQNPHLHNQGAWASARDEDGEWIDDQMIISADPNICNTTLCIAGTAQLIANGVKGIKKFKSDEDEAVDEAARLLGLDKTDASNLFFTFDDERALDMVRQLAAGRDIYGN